MMPKLDTIVFKPSLFLCVAKCLGLDGLEHFKHHEYHLKYALTLLTNETAYIKNTLFCNASATTCATCAPTIMQFCRSS